MVHGGRCRAGATPHPNPPLRGQGNRIWPGSSPCRALSCHPGERSPACGRASPCERMSLRRMQPLPSPRRKPGSTLPPTRRLRDGPRLSPGRRKKEDEPPRAVQVRLPCPRGRGWREGDPYDSFHGNAVLGPWTTAQSAASLAIRPLFGFGSDCGLPTVAAFSPLMRTRPTAMRSAGGRLCRVARSGSRRARE